MRYGIILTAGDIHEIAAMAPKRKMPDGTVSLLGWHGHSGRDPIYDPWVTLAAVAMRTERVRFGAIITPARPSPPLEARARDHDA